MTKYNKRKYAIPCITTITIDCSISTVMHSDEGGPPSGPFGVSSESESIFPDSPSYEDDTKLIFNGKESPFER